VIFALAGVLPLLLFAWALHQLGVVERLEAQLSLGLALAVFLLGFTVFRVLMDRTAAIIHSMGRAAEPGRMLSESGMEAVSEVVTRAAQHVPGIGAIREFGKVALAVDQLQSVWKAEATPHVGRRVLVSVRNSARPIAGTLAQVTDDGVLLDQSGEQMAVSYRRISAIELDRSPTG
jgi:hypothetical protein